jgi:PAS domain S-box-containing protein
MRDQVWIMTLDLKVTYISPSVEKLLGYTLDELKLLPLNQLLPSASYKIAMDFFSVEMPKALAVPPAHSANRFLEFEFRCKDGRIIWMESTFSLIRDENGKPLSILSEGRIINDRKQIEYDLRASESNFRHSIDDSPLGVRISTLKGETIYANRAVLDMYGYDSIEELKNTPLKERYTPESHAEFQLRKAKRLRGEFGPSEYGISILRKNGEIRNLHVFRKEIFWNGKKQSQVIYQDVTERRQAEEKLRETLESLRKSIKTTIQVLGTVAETRDPYTAGHQKKVADLARAIATEMKLSHDKIEGIRMAGAIHDIGKISIPSEILCKPIVLTDLEFAIIKAHAQYSYEIIKDVESPWPLADIVYQHHERINGSGYPQGLKGENILMEARILAVADVVEAMISYRPYRPALGVEIALAEIEQNAGTLYDRKAADACLKLFREKGFSLE